MTAAELGALKCLETQPQQISTITSDVLILPFQSRENATLRAR